MARWLRDLAAFLCIGAAINAALAMGFIWLSRVQDKPPQDHGLHEMYVQRRASIGMTLLVWICVQESRRGSWPKPPSWSETYKLPRPYPTWDEVAEKQQYVWRHEYAAGAPMRAFVYSYDQDAGTGGPFRWLIQSGIALPAHSYVAADGPRVQPRAIPTRIIPDGFAINTLFFALLAAVTWYAALGIRRHRRRRGNRCLECGYSRAGLGEDVPCPECGSR